MAKINRKIIIINGFERREMEELINWYKKNPHLPPVIFAVVTEHSIEWKLGDLLNELIKEDEEMKKRAKGK